MTEAIQVIEILLSSAGFLAIIKLIHSLFQNKHKKKISEQEQEHKLQEKQSEADLSLRVDFWSELKETQEELEKFKNSTINDLSDRLHDLEDRLSKCNQDLLDCKEEMLEELQKIKLGKLDE